MEWGRDMADAVVSLVARAIYADEEQQQQQRSAARAVPSPAAGDSITQTSRGGDFEPAASAAKVSEPPSPPLHCSAAGIIAGGVCGAGSLPFPPNLCF